MKVFLAIPFLILLPAMAENWPQFRGPASQGISSEANLPSLWTPEKNIAWKTELPGTGHSSPVIWGKRVFLTTSIEGPADPQVKPPKHSINGEDFVHPQWAGGGRKVTLKLLALDATSGRILWDRTVYDAPIADYRHQANTYASPTPVTDGKYVVASFGGEGIYCYDLDGNRVWSTQLGPFNQIGMGAGTSPALHEDLVFLQWDVKDNGEGSFLVALNKRTGKEVWRVPRKIRSTWSTPVIARGGNRDELIASGAENVVAYDPRTGRELWAVEGVESNAVPSPVVGHGIVIASAGSEAKRAIAIRLGEKPEQRIAWTYNKGTAYVPSPILYGDYVYLVTDRGLLTCLDARTGELRYEGRRVPVPARFMASPVAFDGKIFLTSDEGETFVIRAGPDYEVLGTNKLGEGVHASPAISGGAIYIRGDKHLFCIRPSAS